MVFCLYHASGFSPSFTAAACGGAEQIKFWRRKICSGGTWGRASSSNAQFPPHRIIGNIYYVGTEALASFLVTTPEGLILINSAYEGVVPVIRKSVGQLGSRFTDIKILLGSHAHADPMEGDALVKELTGARVMAMAEDVPALV